AAARFLDEAVAEEETERLDRLRRIDRQRVGAAVVEDEKGAAADLVPRSPRLPDRGAAADRFDRERSRKLHHAVACARAGQDRVLHSEPVGGRIDEDRHPRGIVSAESLATASSRALESAPWMRPSSCSTDPWTPSSRSSLRTAQARRWILPS